MAKDTIFECRCCDRSIGGYTDGRFGYDSFGQWRHLVGVDGPTAICPTCQADPECLDHLVRDGYPHVAIAVQVPVKRGRI